MFDIGFLNDSGMEDGTEFDIHGTMSLGKILEELTGLFQDFCRENGFSQRRVLYIYYAGRIAE